MGTSCYAIYLRKSRADLDAERRGEGETLARHRRALTQLAESRGLNVVKIYEEIVSADTISDRPQMQALLAAVEAGEYAGVIVNDADRLARGDSIDQGVVKQAFYTSKTLIITPFKTYDPDDESDEDFFDFSLFMARFEYRKTKLRLQTGRMRSAAEGNYLGSRPVFGYRRVKREDRSGWTLEIIPEEAEIVRMVFNWYAYGENGKPLGSEQIANRLNAMGLKSYLGGPFFADRVRRMLRLPIYIGEVSWNKNVKRVRSSGGVRTVTREKNSTPIVVENAHPAIIDRALWDLVQSMFRSHKKIPKSATAPVANVLAGLVKCSICGRTMQRKPDASGRPDTIYCVTSGCPTKGIYIPLLERAILDVLQDWPVLYSKPQASEEQPGESSEKKAIERQLATLGKQLDSLHDFLEQGIYSPTTFVQRRDELTTRIESARARLDELDKTPTVEDLIRAELPQVVHVLEAYPLTEDIELKNLLLKNVISYVSYSKTRQCFRNENPLDYLEIEVFPRIP